MICPRCGSNEFEQVSPKGKGVQYRCKKCGYTGPALGEYF